jgi:hypothetical protein
LRDRCFYPFAQQAVLLHVEAMAVRQRQDEVVAIEGFQDADCGKR